MFNSNIYTKIKSQKIQLKQQQQCLEGVTNQKMIDLINKNIKRHQNNIKELEYQLYFK